MCGTVCCQLQAAYRLYSLGLQLFVTVWQQWHLPIINHLQEIM